MAHTTDTAFQPLNASKPAECVVSRGYASTPRFIAKPNSGDALNSASRGLVRGKLDAAPPNLTTFLVPNLSLTPDHGCLLPNCLTRLAFESTSWEDVDVRVLLRDAPRLIQLELSSITITGLLLPPTTNMLTWETATSLTFDELRPLARCASSFRKTDFSLPPALQSLCLGLHESLQSASIEPRPFLRSSAFYCPELARIKLSGVFAVALLGLEDQFPPSLTLLELESAQTSNRDPFRNLPSGLLSLKIAKLKFKTCATHNVSNMPAKLTSCVVPQLRLFPDSIPDLPKTLTELTFAGGAFWMDTDVGRLQEHLGLEARISMVSACVTGSFISPTLTQADWNIIVSETNKALGDRVQCRWDPAHALFLPATLTTLDLRLPGELKSIIRPPPINWPASIASCRSSLTNLTLECGLDPSALRLLPPSLLQLTLFSHGHPEWSNWICGALPRTLKVLNVHLALALGPPAKVTFDGLPPQLEVLNCPDIFLLRRAVPMLPSTLRLLCVKWVDSQDLKALSDRMDLTVTHTKSSKSACHSSQARFV